MLPLCSSSRARMALRAMILVCKLSESVSLLGEVIP